jgi:hypothetical protein
LSPSSRPNAFRKFGVDESYELKLPRCFDRLRLQEPRPFGDGLAYGPRTGAWPPWREHAAAGEGAPAADDAGLLLVRQDVVEGPEAEPHAADHLQNLSEAHAQRGNLAGRGARSSAMTALANTIAAISCAPLSTV